MRILVYMFGCNLLTVSSLNTCDTLSVHAVHAISFFPLCSFLYVSNLVIFCSFLLQSFVVDWSGCFWWFVVVLPRPLPSLPPPASARVVWGLYSVWSSSLLSPMHTCSAFVHRELIDAFYLLYFFVDYGRTLGPLSIDRPHSASSPCHARSRYRWVSLTPPHFIGWFEASFFVCLPRFFSIFYFVGFVGSGCSCSLSNVDSCCALWWLLGVTADDPLPFSLHTYTTTHLLRQRWFSTDFHSFSGPPSSFATRRLSVSPLCTCGAFDAVVLRYGVALFWYCLLQRFVLLLFLPSRLFSIWAGEWDRWRRVSDGLPPPFKPHSLFSSPLRIKISQKGLCVVNRDCSFSPLSRNHNPSQLKSLSSFGHVGPIGNGKILSSYIDVVQRRWCEWRLALRRPVFNLLPL